MNSYLEKFRSSLPATQGKQILRLLTEKRDSGEIKTLDEFKENLKSLTTNLLAQKITPSLRLWPAIAGQETSSEQYNDMLDKLRDDLETAFAEANTIDEIIEAHHQLITQVSLKTLRLSLNQLDSQISLYEFLIKNEHGFDDSLFNTFRETESLASIRKNNQLSMAFYDPRIGEVIDSDEDAQIDIVGDRLIMGTVGGSYINCKGAKFLSNSNSTRSELDVSFSNSNINNIIDGQSNTYWAFPILLSEISSTGVFVEVQIELNGYQDVNFVEIEPASYYPMVLSTITYLDSNRTSQTAASPNLLLKGPTRVDFTRITTQYLQLRFRQDNYKETQFTKKEDTGNNFYKVLIAPNFINPVNIDNVKNDLEETTTSSFLLDEVFNLPSTVQDQKKYYEYVLGLDNVRPGYASYLDRSIYVSKVKHVDLPGVIGLQTEEKRPIQTISSTSITNATYSYPTRSSTEDSNFYHGSIEYWLFTQFFDEFGKSISTDYIPMLPIDAQRVYHERLILTDKSVSSYTNYNAGSLMFYVLADPSNVIVYRNQTQLVYTTDWAFSSDVDLTVTNPADSTSRMRRGIQLTVDPDPLDIYTVSYTPTVSNTYIRPSNTDLLTLVSSVPGGDIRVVTDNIHVVDVVRDSSNVASLDCCLVVIFRRNSSKENLCPAVEEFMLLFGSNNTEKFLKDY